MCYDRRTRERLACKTILKANRTDAELVQIKSEIALHDMLSGARRVG